jgi:hypothetical protein
MIQKRACTLHKVKVRGGGVGWVVGERVRRRVALRSTPCSLVRDFSGRGQKFASHITPHPTLTDHVCCSVEK